MSLHDFRCLFTPAAPSLSRHFGDMHPTWEAWSINGADSTANKMKTQESTVKLSCDKWPGRSNWRQRDDKASHYVKDGSCGKGPTPKTKQLYLILWNSDGFMSGFLWCKNLKSKGFYLPINSNWCNSRYNILLKMKCIFIPFPWHQSLPHQMLLFCSWQLVLYTGQKQQTWRVIYSFHSTGRIIGISDLW